MLSKEELILAALAGLGIIAKKKPQEVLPETGGGVVSKIPFAYVPQETPTDLNDPVATPPGMTDISLSSPGKPSEVSYLDSLYIGSGGGDNEATQSIGSGSSSPVSSAAISNAAKDIGFMGYRAALNILGTALEMFTPIDPRDNPFRSLAEKSYEKQRELTQTPVSEPSPPVKQPEPQTPLSDLFGHGGGGNYGDFGGYSGGDTGPAGAGTGSMGGPGTKL